VIDQARISLRLLGQGDLERAAAIHQSAGALIPGYDTSQHCTEEFRRFYREVVFLAGPIWGAFAESGLLGQLALLPGWIDHLYVEPTWHGRGIGSRLVHLAQDQQDELRLYTFQSNLRARAFYERHGFVIEELTNGDRNEEKMPDCTYHWQRPAAH
jgi:putative acetyltransferase